MHRRIARAAALTALAVLASILTTVTANPAQAAPPAAVTQWPPVDFDYVGGHQATTSPRSDYTIGCNYPWDRQQDLVTYGINGGTTRHLDRTSMVGSVNNCLTSPVVDKNGDVYGMPYGGTSILAYAGNVLKWSYPFSCPEGYTIPSVVGANGNIYAINGSGRLVGITPEVEAGKTQPKKVLDIATKGGCTGYISLRAFTTGLAVIWASNGTNHRITYYKYDGTLMVEPTTVFTGDANYPMSDFPLNATGRLFYPTSTLVPGDPVNGRRDLKISAYDPTTKTVAWTTKILTTANPFQNAYKAYPLPSGGAVITIKGAQPDVDNVSMKVYILAANGTIARTISYPWKNADGTGSGIISYAAVDTLGSFIFVRDSWEQVQTAIQSVPITRITVLNTSTGVTTYDTEFRDSADTLGYKATGRTGSSSLVIGLNTAYLNMMRCPGNCFGNYSAALYPVKVPGLGMDFPRGAVIGLPTGTVKQDYVALGDSFSSAEGVEPFDASTAVAGTNECHRSANAYSRVLTRDPMLPLALNFGACSGAETKHVKTDKQWGEVAQFSRVSASTEIVSLTIGGNDIGFVNFATACVIGVCRIGSPAYTTALGKVNGTLPAALTTTYEKLLASTNAQIYVLGYPQVAPPNKVVGDLWDARCPFFYDSGVDGNGSDVPYRWADAAAAQDIVGRINSHIERIIFDKRKLGGANLRLHYVEVNAPDSPFAGHEVCSTSNSFFNNLDQWPGHPAYAFHPNALGQEAYAKLLKKAITTQG